MGVRRTRWVAWAALALAASAGAAADVRDVTVLLGERPVNTFVPEDALGAGVDGHEAGAIRRIYTRGNVAAMRSAGLGALTYRLRTELGIEAWHWNPRGAWSDPRRECGYWTSDDRPGPSIDVCHGYRLPRRGNTIDQANNNGYSRLDDGDARTFWKSSPYLDASFTGEDNAFHPQWVVIDLGARRPVNAVRILWGQPYSVAFDVERWDGSDDPYTPDSDPGRWRAFPRGVVTSGSGGDALLRLCDRPIAARYVRLLLRRGSGTAPVGATDRRDRLGYAIREIGVGAVDAGGRFHDAVRHGRSASKQTLCYVSSTDPWHRAIDRDPLVEQPGIDRVCRSGLTAGRPLLVPVGVLFDTPDNAAALVRYLRARGQPIRGVEMGEEPDEQYVEPEAYGALYLQVADAIHRAGPRVVCGGPCYETLTEEVRVFPRERRERGWMRRLLAYLRERGRLSDLGFFSFEWYPFDDVRASTASQLLHGPELLARGLARLRSEGLPAGIPWLMTEYGYSAFSARQEVDLPGALFNADAVGAFLTMGGDAAYLYGYEPADLIREGEGTWGNNAILLADEDGGARWKTATYHGARLLARIWTQPGGGEHRMYRAVSGVRQTGGQPLVTAYAVVRPDGLWSILLVNKDPDRSWTLRLRLRDERTGRVSSLRGPGDAAVFGRAQYAWRDAGEHGRPIRSLPPRAYRLPAGDAVVRVPPYSLTVVRVPGPVG